MKDLLGCGGSLVLSLVIMPLIVWGLGVPSDAFVWAYATLALLILVGCLTWTISNGSAR